MNMPPGVDSLGFQPHITVFIIGSIVGLSLVALGVAGRFIHKLAVIPANRKIQAAHDVQRKAEAKKPKYKEDYYYYGIYRNCGPALHDDGGDGWWGAVAIVGILTAVWLVIAACVLIPYDTRYWSYFAASGEVESVKPVLTATDGNAINSWYLVKLQGNPTVYEMTDPRIVGVEGHVELLCSAAWSQAGYARDVWSCSIRETATN